MGKQILDERAKNVASRIEGINEWIKNNPQVSEPNYYEIMDCLVDVAVINAVYKKWYDRNGYPMNYTSKDIVSFDEDAKACFDGINTMLNLRHIGLKEDSFDALDEPSKLINEVYKTAATCEYVVTDSTVVNQMKKDVLCQTMGVAYYIWQVQKNDVDYKYDNKIEFEEIKNKVEKCDIALGHFLHRDDEGNVYHVGQQFDLEIKGLIDHIEKSYKYSDVYNNKIKK